MQLQTIDRRAVSFVTPVYNKAPYLPAVLEAMGAQTGDFEREYIFVDDGSTDRSLEILRERTRDWPNTTIVAQENQGQARAANRGVGMATMPYTKYMDADDLLVENAVDTLLNALHGTDASVVYGGWREYKKLAEVDLSPVNSTPTAPHPVENPLQQIMRNGIFNPSQALMRTDCIGAVGGSDERIVHGQEYSLSLRLAACWPFLRIDETVAYILTTGEERLTADRGGQHWRVTMATAYFIEDHPETADALKLQTCRRSAKRALLYSRRRHRFEQRFRWYYMVLRTYLPYRIPDPVAFIKTCATAFSQTGTS